MVTNSAKMMGRLTYSSFMATGGAEPWQLTIAPVSCEGPGRRSTQTLFVAYWPRPFIEGGLAAGRE